MNKKLKAERLKIINRDGQEKEREMERGDSKSSLITPAVCKELRGIFQHLPSNDNTIYFMNTTEQTGMALPSLDLFINPF